MNPATFGSLPGACTTTTAGSNGPDRIAHYIYEYAGEIERVEEGYGTPLVRNSVLYARSPNGQVTRIYDGKNNVTRYAYDGHDRLIRTCYNSTATACNNGTAADKVQLTYDSVGRLTNRGLRGHSVAITIAYSYDDLGRLKTIDYPGPSIFDSDVTMNYDNLGRLLSANDANTHSSTFTYDVLGNVTGQGDSISTRVMEYDAAGRRTRMYWSPTDYLTYHYNGVGEMTAIKEKGVDTLVTFEYDDLGRRKKLTRGNGVVTDYSYDGGSRLTGLVNNLTGTAHDQTLGFTYNPAGQIATKSWSNSAYAWAGHVDVNRTYATNTLNQYTASGSVTPTYDVKGNLASAGGSTYTYSTKNELVQTSDTGKQFYYDPLGRMDTLLVGGATSQIYQYDGSQISLELASNFAIQRRYVWGPNPDEPLVWYEGSALTAANRRYLVADERGSVVAVTNNSGTVLGVNTYDDHGIPGSGNIGRFQYTGQAWIPELGMYNYKARIYSPTLGRFMQTDPIGYADGMNWYDYVGGDPVNRTDPSGLACRIHIGTGAWNDRPTTVICDVDRTLGMDRVGVRPERGGLGRRPAPAPPENMENIVVTAQNANRSDCIAECAWILNRPKPYKWSDRNEFAFEKCVKACMVRDPNALPQNPAPAPQPPAPNKNLPNQPSSTSWFGAIVTGVVVVIGGIVYIIGTTF